ncbi:MAG: type II toxin-antitoxin system HipA family toxin [Akkermansiaceae bacterium]
MSVLTEVKLWGTTIGAARVGDYGVCEFGYDPDFLLSGIELAPVKMPLSSRVYRFPELSADSFKGLPGMLADSLPDKFGNAIIDAWLARHGRSRESMNAVERLCYIGTRGMGALEYHPTLEPTQKYGDLLEIRDLVQLASAILTHRDSLDTYFAKSGEKAEVNRAAFDEILRVGTSAGGARAKALIAWNEKTNEVRSGQVSHDADYSQWLIKFDGVQNNRDKEAADPQGFGLIEYAYYLMAQDAGVIMPECRLFEENGRSHFMAKRFDRTPEGGKLHMQSLAALDHLDFNMAGAHSYEQAYQMMQTLSLSKVEMEQQFRRMIFNIVARNQDDHVKNISYLMDRHGEWSLSPAYDVTYSYNPNGNWTSAHQMTLNGKRDHFLTDDFIACEKLIGLPRGRAKRILAEVVDVVKNWQSYANQAQVYPEHIEKIQATHRLEW